jgi:hypothetical protein
MDNFVSIVIPRMKDSAACPSPSTAAAMHHLPEGPAGLSGDQFNKSKAQVMSITFVTSAMNNQESVALLTRLGMPFR